RDGHVTGVQTCALPISYQEQQKSFSDLVTVLVLAIVLIFLVLLFEFRSYTAPIAILSSAVLSTSGVFFALLITRTEFNVSSFMEIGRASCRERVEVVEV